MGVTMGGDLDPQRRSYESRDFEAGPRLKRWRSDFLQTRRTKSGIPDFGETPYAVVWNAPFTSALGWCKRFLS